MAVTNTATTLKDHTTAPVILASSLICIEMKMVPLVKANIDLELTTTHVMVRGRFYSFISTFH